MRLGNFERFMKSLLLIWIACFVCNQACSLVLAGLTQEGTQLFVDILEAHKGGYAQLEKLLARAEEIEQVVDAQPIGTRPVFWLLLSRAQRRVVVGSDAYDSKFVDRARRDSTAASEIELVAIQAETILVAKHIVTIEQRRVESAVEAAKALAKLEAPVIAAATRYYGERPYKLLTDAESIAKDESLSELRLRFATMRVSLALQEFGPESSSYGSALFKRAISLLDNESLSLGDLYAANAVYAKRLTAGETEDALAWIDGLNEYAKVAARSGAARCVSRALDMALVAIKTYSTLALDQNELDNKVAVTAWRATSQLLNAHTRRKEALDLLRDLDRWSAKRHLDAVVRGQILVDIASAELFSGDVESANRKVVQIERLASLSARDRLRLEPLTSELRSMIKIAELAGESALTVGPATKVLLKRVSAKVITESEFAKIINGLGWLPLQDQRSVLQAALANPSVRSRSAIFAQALISLAVVQESHFEYDGARATLSRVSGILVATDVVQRNYLAYTRFISGRLHAAEGNFTAAERDFRKSFDGWGGTTASRNVFERLAALQWLAQCQRKIGALNRLADTIRTFAQTNVSLDVESTKALALVSIQAELEFANGANSAAEALLTKGLRDYAGDVEENAQRNQMPIWPLAAMAKALPNRLEATLLPKVMRQLLLAMDKRCSGEYATILAVYLAQHQLLSSSRMMTNRLGTSLSDRIAALDDNLLFTSFLVDLAAKSALNGKIELAQIAYRQVLIQQSQSIAALPHASRFSRSHVGQYDPMLDRAIALGLERQLMRARTYSEAVKVLMPSGRDTPPHLMMAPVASTGATEPISGGSFIELIAFAPSVVSGRCVTAEDRQPYVGVFVVKDGELTDFKLGPSMTSVREQGEVLVKETLALRDDVSDMLANQLYDDLLKDGVDLLAQADVVTIRPDAELANIPYGFLVQASKKDRRSSVRILPPANVLVRAAYPRSSQGEIVIFANPSYGPPSAGRQPIFQSLPGSEKEATDIAAIFDARVKTYEAKEATVKNLLMQERPAVLHIATHAYIDEHLATPANSQQGRIADFGVAMVATRIAFARANENEGNLSTVGLASSLAIASLDLRGTQLVVFSACEAGVTTHSIGRLSTGMSLSAHLAGARTVIAPLWRVSDVVSAILMKHFYIALAAGERPSNALAKAQNVMRTSSPYRSPFYWAGYTVSGSDEPVVLDSSIVE